jgi:hypothetical protein
VKNATMHVKLDAQGQPIGWISTDGRIVGDDEIVWEIALGSLGIRPEEICQMVKYFTYLHDSSKYSRQVE